MTKSLFGGLNAAQLLDSDYQPDFDSAEGGDGDSGNGGEGEGEGEGDGDGDGEGDAGGTGGAGGAGEGDAGDGDGGSGDGDAGAGEGEGNEGDEGTVASLMNEFGFTPPEGKTYEETYEGMRELVNDITLASRNAVFGEIEESLPDVAQYLEYRLNGGDPSKFFDRVKKINDYSQLTLENNPAAQKQVYKDFLVRSGFTPEEADEEVMEAEQLELLEKKATVAKTKLAALTAQEQKAEQERLEKEAKEQEEVNRKELQAVQQVIKSGKLATFEVPEAEKAVFWNWLMKPIDRNGTTAREKAAAEMTREQRLALEYLVFKGVDLTKVKIAKPAAGGGASSQRALPKKPGAGSRMGGGGNRGNEGGGSKGKLPTLKDILG